MDNLSLYLTLIPALPLAAAVLVACLGAKVLKDQSHLPIILALAGSCFCSYQVYSRVAEEQQIAAKAAADQHVAFAGYEHVVTLWRWMDVTNAYDLPRTVANESPLSLVDEGPRSFQVDITLRADAINSMMLVMVTFISTLVAIFAAGYMHGESGYWRFFSYIGLFVFSMTMLVSVSNFILLFVFWEAVGACSYLLIGFWYHKPEAAAAGMKAFLVNRVGDFGFALALFTIWTTYGTLNFHDSLADGTVEPKAVAAALEMRVDRLKSVSDQEKPSTDAATADAGNIAAPAPQLAPMVRGVLGRSRVIANDYVGGGIALAICLLLMLGACGKSAQFPLHVWLPDAMEGPTPVSALIHAATMVTAGVYMVARCSPLFFASPEAQLIVAIIGGFTAVLAGLIALTQWDLKRVLAYSTVSQLGFMFLALGVGTFAGVTAAMFHLFTHAFFKALLFLGSGSVMHAMGHIIDMRQFGGLRKLMPWTHRTFLVGCLALAGVFPLSGFWSKDSILGALHDKIHSYEHELEHRQHSSTEHAQAAAGETYVSLKVAGGEHGKPSPLAGWTISQVQRFRLVYQTLYNVALFTAFLTAFYTFRAYCLTFWGEERIPEAAGHHAHESPPLMTVPLVILAICAVLVGMVFLNPVNFGDNSLVNFLGNAPSLSATVVAATKAAHPHFHLDVAGFSSLAAFGGIGLALYLYLGDRNAVTWLQRLFSMTGAEKLTDFAWIPRLRNIGWIGFVDKQLRQMGLGILATIVGYLLGFISLILALPILVGQFVTPYKLSQNKFYFDEIYTFLIVRPLELFAVVFAWLDRWVVDGLVNLVGSLPRIGGNLMRPMQSGQVQFYALIMAVGVVLLILAQAFAR